MKITIARWASAGVMGVGLVGLALAASPSGPDDPPPRPRPGLTSQQSKEAVKLAQRAMVELRKKTEGASNPGADRREYVIGVELLAAAQGCDFHAPLASSEPLEALRRLVRSEVPHLDDDRHFHPDMEKAIQLVRSGAAIAAVGARLPGVVGEGQ